MTQHMTVSAGKIVRINTTHKPDNSDAIKAAGFQFNGFDQWTQEATSSDHMIELVKVAVNLGGAIILKSEKMLDETEKIFGPVAVVVNGTRYSSINAAK